MWIVDESSFLSQRQKAQLDHMAAKAGAKVVYLGDTLQLQGVEAGKPFELAQKQGGIETAYMTEISRQNTPDLKAAVDIITGRDQLTDGGRLTAVELKNNARAFEHMDKTGMVKEVTNGGLIDAAVKDVLAMSAAERERTIVITAYNKDRHEINAGVRDGLKQTGEVSRIEQNKEIFISKGWTRAVTKEAQYYNAGDVVRFGRDYKQIDAAKGEYARVVSTDATRGVVLLQKENGQTIAWEPKKNNNVEVYDAERRDIAKGDIIRMTRNEGEFKNGEVARVAAIDGDKVKLELKQGEAISYHDVDLAKSKHWDYAYASTVHASQGATQHRAMFVIRAPEDENEKKQARQLEAMAKVFGNRSFYVGSTRASHELSIYTNDKAVAAKAVSAQQDKTSAVETLHRAEQARDKTVGVDR
jgi:ATP-dependent exoDNAse (exonuclease V) alpha subunit